MSEDNKDLKFILNPETGVSTVGAHVPTKEEYHAKPVPGMYKVVEHIGMFSSFYTFDKFEVALPNTAAKTSDLIMDTKEIDELFSEDSLRIHKAMGTPAKIGFLLHGPQGTGKSTAMYSIAEQLVKNYGAVVLQCDDQNDLRAALKHIENLRKLEPTLLVVAIMDECEGPMERYEKEMKLLLDSKDTPSNFIFIGATNYIELIPATIKQRPSRIKHLFDCKAINEDEIIVFTILTDMNKELAESDQLSGTEVKKITKQAVGKTIDEIKHLFLGVAIHKAQATPKPKIKKKSGNSKTVAAELN